MAVSERLRLHQAGRGLRTGKGHALVQRGLGGIDEPDRNACFLGSHESDTRALWWGVSFAAAPGSFTCQLRLTICPAPMTPSLFTWAALRAAEELKSLAWLASRMWLILKAALDIIFGHGFAWDVTDKQVASRKSGCRKLAH